jgi:hypothetical protein
MGAGHFKKYHVFMCLTPKVIQRPGSEKSALLAKRGAPMERSGAVIFSLSISFLCALLAGYFSGLVAYFPPPLFVPLRYYYSTHNNTVRPRHRCLPPLRCCRRHPSPSAPPAAYCLTIAAIGPLPLPLSSLDRYRAAAAPPALLPPLHLNVALDVHNLAASPQHGLLPVVR